MEPTNDNLEAEPERPHGYHRHSRVPLDTVLWALLFAVALPLAGLRYGGILPDPVIATVKQCGLSYGVWALLAIHVMIVVKAAQ